MTVSVILCTYNPDPGLLRWTLDSLGAQTHREFELLVVDNGSTIPLDEAVLRQQCRHDLRLIRESQPGLVHARCAGINNASGELLVFVDDDNHLDPDYVEQAVSIASEEPAVGHFGGIARAKLEKPIARWKHALLPYLGVRDYGNQPITSAEARWGEWEPIGAGMVTRRDVARQFVRTVRDQSGSGMLGRRGAALMSGEDSLMARAANQLGFSCSYQPSLKLTHFMKAARLKPWVLARTLEGHGRSFVVLERVLQRPVDPPPLSWIARELVVRYIHRVRHVGLPAGTITWFWDLGFVRQARKRP